MRPSRVRRPPRRGAILLGLAVTLLGLASCSDGQIGAMLHGWCRNTPAHCTDSP